MESDENAGYYDTVYSNHEYTPEQKTIGHGWKWTY